ncbi:MAG: HTH domain-containing protein [Oscillospiraceae bacterium]|nr:HTH domain-containing protein [Oscillospiraceae bacterium]
MDAVEMLLLFDYYGDMLTERQRMCLDLRYNQDLSLAEIAEELGVSRQGVHDNITRAEAHLAKMEAKTGCVRRNLQSRQSMQAILSVAKELEQYPDPVVRDAIEKIVAAASSIEE